MGPLGRFALDSQPRPTVAGTIYDLQTGLTPEEMAAPGFPLPIALPADRLKEIMTIGCGFADYQHYVVRPDLPLDDPNYGDYIHGGVDFRVPAGTPVRAIMGGKVTVYPPPGAEESINSKYHTVVTILECDDAGEETGRKWIYAHMDNGSIPSALAEAAAAGTPIAAGSHIGDVTRWIEGEEMIPDQIDVSDGKRYDHLHLAMQVKDAAGDDHYFNILKYLPLEDTTPPEISALHFVQDGTIRTAAGEVPEVSGAIDVVLEAHDRVDAWHRVDGELQKREDGGAFKLGVYRAAVTVQPADGDALVYAAELPGLDRFSENRLGTFRSDAQKHRHLRALELEEGRAVAIGDREARRSFLVPTNVVEGVADRDGAWDTTRCPDGLYRVTARAEDERGNSTSRTRLVRVKNQQG